MVRQWLKNNHNSNSNNNGVVDDDDAAAAASECNVYKGQSELKGNDTMTTITVLIKIMAVDANKACFSSTAFSSHAKPSIKHQRYNTDT